MAKKKQHTVIILFLVIAIVIALIVMIAVFVNENKEPAAEKMSGYDVIMAYDFDTQYPSTAMDVIEVNNYINKYMCSSEVTTEQVPDIIAQQRKLYAKKLLQLNNYEAQVAAAIEDVTKWQKEELYILDIKSSVPMVNEEYPDFSTCDVLVYMNKGDNKLATYLLVKEYSEWKVLTWEEKDTTTDESTNTQ